MVQVDERRVPGPSPTGVMGADALRLANGRRLPLVGGDLSLGRAPSNDIVLDDPTIAAHQARLLRFPEGWLLSDLAGNSATEVNGERVTYPIVLAAGDEIGLGRLVAAFEPDGAVVRTADPPAVALEPAGAVAAAAGPPATRFEPDRAVGGTAVPPAAAPDASPLAAPTWALPRPAALQGTPLVQLDGVVKSYPASAGPLTVLREVSLSIGAGEFVAIVGPSGCGKSTLLNVITGIDRPDAGTVLVAGEDLARMGSDTMARWRGRTIGIVFQFFQLLPTLTVAENVMLPMAFCQTARGR
jgi:ABC-type multidrug transport system fused ATPase/permease subunit